VEGVKVVDTKLAKDSSNLAYAQLKMLSFAHHLLFNTPHIHSTWIAPCHL